MPLLYYDPLFLAHETGDHPECPARLLPAARLLHQFTTVFGCERPGWTPIARADLELVHTPEYLDFLQRTCEDGGGQLDPDTTVCPRSYEVALQASGAVADAVARVLRGNDSQAFCLLRPPGHHALADRAMGFCLLNHVAVGARMALARHGLERVLIVDWDVHHGNGTQAIFWEDPQVGFFSMHRFPFYPGTGTSDEIGAGAAAGTKLNLPIEIGTPREAILDQFETHLQKIAAKMRPELILLSAGFDAHRLDPYGSLGLETDDFGKLTHHLASVAREYCQGRIVSILEGGYHPMALAESVDAHLHELMRV